jgi:uncharacterized protein YceH (UPF0502 family)
MPDALELTAVEARVLGALLEKQLTTPDTYPLTLKALVAACNQSSNRDPIVQYDGRLAEAAVLALKAKGLARVVHPGAGERSTRYRQVIDEVLALGADDRALLCVLLLRGPQTLNELKVRTERMYGFESAGAVEAGLDALARRDPPLVARVDRQPGQKEGRWIQLVEGGAEARAAAPPPAASVTPSATRAAPDPDRLQAVEDRIAALEARVAALAEALGEP